MKLIQELHEDVEYLTEDVEGERKYYVQGIIMQGNIKNGNGRVYPMDHLMRGVNEYITEYVKRNRAFGELNHPSNGPNMNLDKISHKFVELRQDGNNVVGKAKIMTEMPMGKIVKAFIDEDCVLGISSRGLGSIKDRGGVKEVQSDFKLITAGDIVHTPSAPEAYLEALREEKEWVFSAGTWVEKLKEDTAPVVDQIVRETKHDKKERERRFLSLFENFLSRI